MDSEKTKETIEKGADVVFPVQFEMNTRYFKFHKEMMGYSCTINGEQVPKFVLFWAGYQAEDLIEGRTKYTVIDKLFYGAV